MRFKISLEVLSHISGNVLPISYQYELSTAFRQLLTKDGPAFESWLTANGLSLVDAEELTLYSVSNFYIPKIYVNNDRLHINVPRIQFWVSFLPEMGTQDLLRQLFARQMVVGDEVSSVAFKVIGVDDVTPVYFHDHMEYQSLSPIVVTAYRENDSLEYLNPSSPYFFKFMYEGLIERWEQFYGQRFEGVRGYNCHMLAQERRKSINVIDPDGKPKKVIGYMLKFCLEMDPELQHFAYVAGLGDHIDEGFGYVELLKKTK